MSYLMLGLGCVAPPVRGQISVLSGEQLQILEHSIYFFFSKNKFNECTKFIIVPLFDLKNNNKKETKQKHLHLHFDLKNGLSDYA